MSLNEKEITIRTREMLLGRLSDEERSKFESEFIHDETVFESVRVAEDELIEQFAMDTLSSDDRRAFETEYLSRESWRRKLALTRSLIERSKFSAVAAVSGSPSLMSRLFAFLSPRRVAVGAGFAVLAILVGGIWFANRKTDEVATQPTTTPSPISTPPAKTPESVVSLPTPEIAEVPFDADKQKEQHPVPTPTPKGERRPMPMIALVAGSLRDGGKMPQLTIGKDADRALLNLKIDSNDYLSFAVQVVDPDGRVVSQARDLQGTKGRVSVAISASKLVSGEYIVKLFGVGTGGELESVADFPLRINRR